MTALAHRPTDPFGDLLARLHTCADHPGPSHSPILLHSRNNNISSHSSEEPAELAIMDTFLPKPHPSSDDFGSRPISAQSIRVAIQAFFATRSRVVQVSQMLITITLRLSRLQLYNLPPSPETVLSAAFLPQSVCEFDIMSVPPLISFRWSQAPRRHSLGYVPVPASLWCVRDEYATAGPLIIWAVFGTHDEVRYGPFSARLGFFSRERV